MGSPTSLGDVFISFRGEDIRKKFISRLNYALTARNITTYVDDQLEKEDEISSTLRKTIQRSKLSVVVFSKNFTSSSWCLYELVQILECKEKQFLYQFFMA